MIFNRYKVLCAAVWVSSMCRSIVRPLLLVLPFNLSISRTTGYIYEKRGPHSSFRSNIVHARWILRADKRYTAPGVSGRARCDLRGAGARTPCARIYTYAHCVSHINVHAFILPHRHLLYVDGSHTKAPSKMSSCIICTPFRFATHSGMYICISKNARCANASCMPAHDCRSSPSNDNVYAHPGTPRRGYRTGELFPNDLLFLPLLLFLFYLPLSPSPSLCNPMRSAYRAWRDYSALSRNYILYSISLDLSISLSLSLSSNALYPWNLLMRNVLSHASIN